MSFHENLIQTFQNFKDVFIGSTDISDIGDGKITGAISALDSDKQDTLTAGENITIDSNGRISATGTDIDDTITSTIATWSSNKINVEFQNKQDTLTAGDNITIDSNNRISATGTDVDDSTTSTTKTWSSSKINTELQSKQDTLTAGDNITIDSNGTISATGGVSNLADLTDVVIVSATNGQIIKYNITLGKWENVDYIDDTSSNADVVWSASKIVTELATKQNTLTAGAGITITNNTISANAGISLTVVQTLPTTDISTNTIYLVPSAKSAQDNIYDEYVYVNNAWEMIGSTAIDLTDYYTSSEVDSLFTSLSTSQSEIDSTQNASISSLASVSTSQTSQIASMSTSLSELATTASSLTTAQSEQAITISSLSTDTSELGSEVEDLASEVADKQDVLTAGEGIEIEQFGDETIIKSSGATIYANVLYPSGS